MKIGDRRDGTLLKNIDSMHIIMPLMYPNRCDNEAYMRVVVDLTEIDKYIEKKNQEHPEYKYTLFQIAVAAMLKTLVLRPKMNRFIANKNIYQRNCYTAAFTMKKTFEDDGDEVLTRTVVTPESTIEDVRSQMVSQIKACREADKKDQSTEGMDMLQKLPRFLLKIVGFLARFLDRHGWMPESIVATDPFQSSVVLSNIGSLHISGGYHHLTNWGTTSIMCMVGEIFEREVKTENGVEFHRMAELGITIDERIADGYYYSKTVRYMRAIFANPEILEQPFNTAMDVK